VTTQARIERVLFEVVDELNRMLPESEHLPKDLRRRWRAIPVSSTRPG